LLTLPNCFSLILINIDWRQNVIHATWNGMFPDFFAVFYSTFSYLLYFYVFASL